jgi:hypothetical protein
LSQLCLTLAIADRQLARAAVIAGAVHDWNANTDTDGNAVWEDTGTLANRHWSMAGSQGPNGTPHRVPVSSATTITHAYSFDGLDDRGEALLENRAGNHNTTFEVWFKPDGLPMGQALPIFEHGNGPRGVTIGLSGDLLVLAYAASPDSASLSMDLDLGDDGLDNLEFIQVIGVVDDTNNQLRLYVNGANEQVAGIASSNDFTSNDDLGLAANVGQGGGGQNATPYTWDGLFAGQIAIVREYRFAFGSAEARQNYQAIAVPEPSAVCLALSGILGITFLGFTRASRKRP